jgi:hypothetical protein
MMKTTSDLVQITALWIIAFMFFVLVLLALFSTEHWNIEIRQSYSTGECVSMIVYDKEHPTGKVHPCPDVLPERYNHIWVQ